MISILISITNRKFKVNIKSEMSNCTSYTENSKNRNDHSLKTIENNFFFQRKTCDR